MEGSKKISLYFGLFCFVHFVNHCAAGAVGQAKTGPHILVLAVNKQNQLLRIPVSIANCTNLSNKLVGKVNSVDTLNNCARFWDGHDCTGSSIEMLPRSPAHNSLAHWGFAFKTISVGPCRDSCSDEITGGAPAAGKEVKLTIFNREDYKGAYEDMNVQGCTLIPMKYIRQFRSAKTYGNCLEFYNNIDCKHNHTAGEDSIELRKGTPLHSHIVTWLFPFARAVSHCSYKCGKPQETKEIAEPANANEIFLFDAHDFKGNQLNLTVTACTELPFEWEGAAVSVKVKDKSCFNLYSQKACQGEAHKIEGTHEDLHDESFDELTRSIGPCS